jgi:hypothetical protein
MPTGYTADIQDGISFEKFTLQCARAFGATIMMRDEPMDAPMPDEFKPSDYHTKELAVAKEKIAELQVLNDEEKAIRCKAAYDADLAGWNKRKAEKEALEVKYKEMLAKVVEWQAPTPDHEGLKQFMIEQIHSSIKWDCNMEYDEMPVELSSEEWHAKMLAAAQWGINYHTKEHAEKVKRSEASTAWVQALKQSLNLF